MSEPDKDVAEWLNKFVRPIEFCDNPTPWDLQDPNGPKCQKEPRVNSSIKCMSYTCIHCHPAKTVQYCRNCDEKLADHPKK